MTFRELEAKFKELNVWCVCVWHCLSFTCLAHCMWVTKFTTLLLIQAALILTAELSRLWYEYEGY